MKARGRFEVELKPQSPCAQGEDGIELGRMSLDKTFNGALVGKSCGEMLSVRTAVKGSAGYVAIEQVSGTLSGRKGSFVLQHFGIMSGGDHRLILEVIPNSGSGELQGLCGTMKLDLQDGEHLYEFEYSLE